MGVLRFRHNNLLLWTGFDSLTSTSDLWCNGSTADFDSVCLGSSPDRSIL